MAESKFRNKQWFKCLTDKEKKDICKRHHCTETGLKKAGYIGDDGKLKIDLLRLDCDYIPENWTYENYVVRGGDFEKLLNQLTSTENDEDVLNVLEEMYCLFNPGTKFKKADVKKSKIWIDQTKLSIINNIKDMQVDVEVYEKDPDNNDIGIVMCHSHKIYTHLKVLFESDIKNIKV